MLQSGGFDDNIGNILNIFSKEDESWNFLTILWKKRTGESTGSIMRKRKKP